MIVALVTKGDLRINRRLGNPKKLEEEGSNAGTHDSLAAPNNSDGKYRNQE
jgi:hypothetical protein